MQDQAIKSKVLEEIMSLMDQNDGERLKGHPKLMAAKVEVKPLEGSPEEEKLESPLEEKSEDNVSAEDLQKLLDLIKE